MSVVPLLVLWLWLGLLAGLAVTARGRAALVRMAGDVGRVSGFRRRGEVGRRWHELAAEDAADPALRRAAAVKDAYLAGEFGSEELDWRILLALMPPPPGPSVHERNWAMAQKAMRERMMEPVDVSGFQAGRVVTFRTAAPRRIEEGPRCRFRELHSGSGYFGAVCECGHDMNRHYNGGCNDCDAFRLPTEPDSRLVAWRRHG